MHRTSAFNRLAAHANFTRGGFTLVELLIVITIISVLLLLTVQVVGTALTYSREAATQATIRKIQGMLSSRAEALHRLIQRPNFVESTPEYQIAGLFLGLPANLNLQKILAIKLLERKYFPQRQQEVLDTVTMGTYFGAGSPQPKISNAPFGTVSSSEILYDFLTQLNVLGDQALGADAFSPSEVRDLDLDGLPEFVDAWGQPLRFYRWPTRLFRSSPPVSWVGVTDAKTGILSSDVANARSLISGLIPVPSTSINDPDNQPDDPIRRGLARDPVDPLRRCAAIPNFESTTIFANPPMLPADVGPYVFHTPITYHLLTVISAGQDGDLGLYEPDDTANFGHLAAVRDPNAMTDNITYLNVRAGGK
ncbi:MAG: prepilin-type N-terminal cleavage/methylation domain-containing protein [Planctomycetaceae bacterium]|nr:prepilin-type N-terminal cleavage/methylation domain-containing protein [Planctomycetaceae bacterium]